MICCFVSVFFFFNDTATTEIYTLSLHDALPISWIKLVLEETLGYEELLAEGQAIPQTLKSEVAEYGETLRPDWIDRKSTRLNSSHPSISYAVFCLKKKKLHT